MLCLPRHIVKGGPVSSALVVEALLMFFCRFSVFYAFCAVAFLSQNPTRLYAIPIQKHFCVHKTKKRRKSGAKRVVGNGTENQ